MFLKERLPSENGDLLHEGRFAPAGRISIGVGELRHEVMRKHPDGTVVHVPVEVRMTGDAEPPLEAYADAHAELVIADRKSAQAVADHVSKHCVIEKPPPHGETMAVD